MQVHTAKKNFTQTLLSLSLLWVGVGFHKLHTGIQYAGSNRVKHISALPDAVLSNVQPVLVLDKCNNCKQDKSRKDSFYILYFYNTNLERLLSSSAPVPGPSFRLPIYIIDFLTSIDFSRCPLAAIPFPYWITLAIILAFLLYRYTILVSKIPEKHYCTFNS